MTSLQERFDRQLAALEPPGGPALVAVSGGPDSVALLHLLVRSPAAAPLVLQVAHADHGISPESAWVAERVGALAGQLRLPFHACRFELGPGASETIARSARYEWLSVLAERIGAKTIFTGHHLDDQIETVLMRVLRGSGPAGLAGIAPRRGRLIRPLLPFRRAELASFVQELGVPVWEDPANADLRHLRSWLRIELLPLLRARLPRIDGSLVELARAAAADRSAWDRLLESLPALLVSRTGREVSFAASGLHGYDSATRLALLGALGRRVGCQLGPSRAERVERLAMEGLSGAVVQLGGGWLAELSFGRLRLFRGMAHPPGWAEWPLTGPAGEAVAGSWRFSWRSDRAPERQERNGSTIWVPPGAYRVRPWRPGDRVRPLGANGRRLVVRCMQDEHIARRDRAAWPVVLAGDTVVWVPGVARSGDALPERGSLALRLDAHHA